MVPKVATKWSNRMGSLYLSCICHNNDVCKMRAIQWMSVELHCISVLWINASINISYLRYLSGIILLLLLSPFLLLGEELIFGNETLWGLDSVLSTLALWLGASHLFCTVFQALSTVFSHPKQTWWLTRCFD